MLEKSRKRLRKGGRKMGNHDERYEEHVYFLQT